MKIKTLTLITLVSFIPINSQNITSGEVIYEASMPLKNKAKIKASAKKYLENLKLVKFQLIFNGNESLYEKVDDMSSDGDSTINLVEILGGGKDKYYHNKTDNIILRQTEKFGEQFLISCQDNQWEIKQEQKQIGGYECFKAIQSNKNGEETVVAWFTSQIPVNFGPKKYNNLPGLILEVHTGGLALKATNIILNPKIKIKIRRIKKGEEMTEKEFYIIANEMSKELFKK